MVITYLQVGNFLTAGFTNYSVLEPIPSNTTSTFEISQPPQSLEPFLPPFDQGARRFAFHPQAAMASGFLYLKRPFNAVSAVVASAHDEGEDALKKLAEDIRGYFNKGLSLGKEGKRVEARDAYRKIFEIDPDVTQKEIHILACLNMGALYLEESNFSDAAYTLKHAVELDPNRIDARSNYAVALLGLERQMTAVHQWSIVLDSIPELRGEGTKLDLDLIAANTIRSLRQLIEAAQSEKKYDVALAAVEILLKHQPTRSDLKQIQIQIKEKMAEKSTGEGPKDFTKKDLKDLSKTIAHALRHVPWEYELELDGEGWVDMNQLITALNLTPPWKHVTRAVIERMIQEVSGGRYEIKGDKIRALYGHSIPGHIFRPEAEPYGVLYHGTDRSFLPSILSQGLKAGTRQYVHLSITKDRALQVARRKGKNPVIITIRASEAFQKGIKFYAGNENVCLAENIPSEFLEIEEN